MNGSGHEACEACETSPGKPGAVCTCDLIYGLTIVDQLRADYGPDSHIVRHVAELESRLISEEMALVDAHQSLVRIRNWLGKAFEQKLYRGDMVDAEGLIEDAYNEAKDQVGDA